jgi:hypothetical protein
MLADDPHAAPSPDADDDRTRNRDGRAATAESVDTLSLPETPRLESVSLADAVAPEACTGAAQGWLADTASTLLDALTF